MKTKINQKEKFLICYGGFLNHPCDDCGTDKNQRVLCLSNQRALELWVCRKHAENYNIVGKWSRVWRNFE
ncbi:MAG: hypothetical protein MRERV_22c008 [Mycoplasmataceae bacterium RV_VA103A]|nr:MAG: hypothetical protein MRERV_22c008 [Mycoplasmataceae bacterium RV_VA103A]